MYKLLFASVLSVSGVWAASHASDSAPVVAPDSFRNLEQAMDDRSHEQNLQKAAMEQEFVQRFNNLAAALEEFARTYKSKHAVDVKQVKSIREAYRKLEQADPWFRAE